MSSPDLTPADVGAINPVSQSSHHIIGPEVESFEADFASFAGNRDGIGVKSGTSGLHRAVNDAGVKHRPQYSTVAGQSVHFKLRQPSVNWDNRRRHGTP